jgi:hypothetical protein
MILAQILRAIQRAGPELPEIMRAAIASGITIAHRTPRLAACRIFTGNQSKNPRELSFWRKGVTADE